VKVEIIRDLLTASPFRAFRIRTGDGKSIPVLHPEVAYITPKGDTVIVTKAKGGLFIMEPPAITHAETIKDEKELRALTKEDRE
jgi:hypothetical protein